MATVSQLCFDNDLTDTAGNVWTANGGATVSTAQKRTGIGSLYIPNGGQIYTPITAGLDIYNKNFVIEFSIFPTATVAYGQVLRVDNDSGTGYSYVISTSSDGTTLNFLASSSGNDWDKLALSLGSVTLNTWSTYRITRDRNTGIYRSYKNCSLVTKLNVVGDFSSGINSKLRIGSAYNNTYSFAGCYVDDIMIATDDAADLTLIGSAISSSDSGTEGSKDYAFDSNTDTSWRSGEYGTGVSGVAYIGRDFCYPCIVKSIYIDQTSTYADQTGVDSVFVEYWDGSSWVTKQTSTITKNAISTISISGYIESTKIRLRANANPSGTNYRWYVKQIVISGTIESNGVVCLMHFDGDIKDASGKVWTANGGIATTTAATKFGGGGSLQCGSGKSLTTSITDDFNFGTSDFTIEWWEYRTSATLSGVFHTGGTPMGTDYPGLLVGWSNGTIVSAYASSNKTSWDILNSLSFGNVILNAWTHYALTRCGSTFRTFQNGVLISTATSSASLTPCAGVTLPTIGAWNGVYFAGNIDELCITKGVAKWASSFSPLLPPYDSKDGVVALLRGNESVTKDEMENTWTNNGGVVVDTSKKMFGTSSIYTKTRSNVMATIPGVAFGYGDFTIDFWMYRVGTTGYPGISSATGDSNLLGFLIQPDNIGLGYSGDVTQILAGAPFLNDRWSHYALTRCNGVCYWFVNGTLQASATAVLNLLSNYISINSRYGTGSMNTGVAYYDEVRISNFARWTANFNPPTEPHGSMFTDIIPTMVGLTSPNGQAIPSTVASGYNGYAAFDKTNSATDATKSWASDSADGSPSISYMFPLRSPIIKSYAITATKSSGLTSLTPSSFYLKGSNNGSTWYNLDSRDNISWVTGERKEFLVATPSKFKYNGVFCKSAADKVIGELEMSEASITTEKEIKDFNFSGHISAGYAVNYAGYTNAFTKNGTLTKLRFIKYTDATAINLAMKIVIINSTGIVKSITTAIFRSAATTFSVACSEPLNIPVCAGDGVILYQYTGTSQISLCTTGSGSGFYTTGSVYSDTATTFTEGSAPSPALTTPGAAFVGLELTVIPSASTITPTHRFPLTTDAKDVVAGLTTSNLGGVTFSDAGALFTGNSSTMAITFTKVLSKKYSILFWAKSMGAQSSKFSPFHSAQASNPTGTGIFCSGDVAYVSSNYWTTNGAFDISSKKSKMIDGNEHLHVITFDGATLTYKIDNDQTLSFTTNVAPTNFNFAIGRWGLYTTQYTTWNGTIRDVRIYDGQILSEVDMAAIYAAGPNNINPDPVVPPISTSIKSQITTGGM